MILTIIFFGLLISIFVGLIRIALKATWAIAKCFVVLFLLPIALIALFACGLVYLALPILVIVGIIAILKRGSAQTT